LVARHGSRAAKTGHAGALASRMPDATEQLIKIARDLISTPGDIRRPLRSRRGGVRRPDGAGHDPGGADAEYVEKICSGLITGCALGG